ncbi:MAG: M28 family peptidase [Chloroflexi bacterium]|nr:M28 family peptidase [Chloroflexota bacterium]
MWAVVILVVACGSPAAAPPATASPALLTRPAEATVAAATPVAAPSQPAPSPSPTELTAPPTPELTPTVEARPSSDRVVELGAQAWDFLTAFTQDFSPRESGTAQEKAAADFLAARFESLGYDVSLQPFKVDVASAEVLIGPEGQDFRSIPLTRSGQGSVTGFLVDAGRAMEEDNISAAEFGGKIALIERGAITFEAKVQRVTEAGAVAAVIYNDRPRLFGGTLSTEASIPVAALSRESGTAILRLLTEGDVEATVSATFGQRDSQNVIAEMRGTAADGGIVILGGHYDTVADVPGANDNGSGIAALVTLAAEVAGESYPFTTRFIPFGSEELGLLGSGAYVDSLTEEERQAIIMMLNFDALATGDVVGLLGDLELMGAAVDFGRANGIEVERRFSLSAGTSSDHARFQQAGIPVVFFLADDFSRIHTAADTLEFVQPELMGGSVALAIHLLESVAGR